MSLGFGLGTPVGFNVFVEAPDGAVYTTNATLRDTVDKTLLDVRDRSIVTVNVPDIARVEVTGSAVDFTAEREPPQPDGIERWRLTAPVEGRADRATLNTLLTRLGSGRAQAFVSEEPSEEDLAAYGLDEPATVLTLWSAGDTAVTLQVGGESEEPEGRYARRLGGNAVFVAPNNLIDLIPDSLDAVRSKAVVSITRDRVNAVELEAADRSLKLEKDGIDWRIIEPALDADATAVSALLSALLGLNAWGFGAEPATSSSYGFDDPHLSATLSLQPQIGAEAGVASESVVLRFGNSTEVVDEADDEEEAEILTARYVSVSGDPVAYVVRDSEEARSVTAQFKSRVDSVLEELNIDTGSATGRDHTIILQKPIL